MHFSLHRFQSCNIEDKPAFIFFVHSLVIFHLCDKETIPTRSNNIFSAQTMFKDIKTMVFVWQNFSWQMKHIFKTFFWMKFSSRDNPTLTDSIKLG